LRVALLSSNGVFVLCIECSGPSASSDVRQEFAKNLREGTDALLPQRLVIFLDDLGRCRPQRVVQILEAINFLSSPAPCFIILGADYRKVETLAGQHFEAIAVQEAENAWADVRTSLLTARKIVINSTV
jgi:hypothetical protein